MNANTTNNRTAVYVARDAARSTSGAHDNPRLAVAIDDYLRACESGHAPDIDAYVEAHADIADELRECLAGLAFLQKAAPNIELSSAAVTTNATLDDAGHEPLGDYRLIRELGRGGMGVVYEAEQRSLSRRVALKVLPFAAVLDPRHLQRFKNEALAAAQLSHPNIVDVYGVGCERGIHFYAMRLVEGQTLAAVIEGMKCGVRSAECGATEGTPHPDSADTPNSELRTSNLSDTAPVAALSTLRTTKPREFFRRVAELGIQAAEALDHAHQMGIVHRDVKPSNLIIDHFGKLWITDFGLARIQNDAGMTMTGDLLGTLRYMSPEQALAKRIVIDHRTDIYSLGVTLYELLTHQPAFEGADREAVLRKIAFDEPVAPRKLNAAIPLDLETIVLKAMAKNPEDRFTTALDCAEDLRRYLANQPLKARRPTPVERLRRWTSRHAALVGMAAAMLAVVAVSAVVAAVLIGRAYRSEVTEHDRAETNLRLAADSVDKMMIRVASSPLYMGDVHQADELISDATNFNERLLDQKRDPEYILHAVATYRRAAWIRYLGGVTDKAEPALRRASELLGELVQLEPDSAQYLDALGHNELELGRVLWAIDQRAGAEAPLRRALETYEQLVKRSPTNSAYQLRLAETLNELARLHWYAGLSEKAESEIARAAKISDSLPAGPFDWHESFYTSAEFRGYGPYEPLRLQGAILNNQALIARKRKDIPQALKLLEQAIAVQDRAQEICPLDPWCRRYGFQHFFARAETFLYAGKHREAGQAIEKMVDAYSACQEAYQLGAELLLRCADLAEPDVGNGLRAVPERPKHVANHQSATAGSTSSVLPSATGSASADPSEFVAESYRDRARKLLEKADKVPSSTTVTQDHFVWFLLTCPDESFRDLERAIKLAQSITQAVPERASARRALGLALYRLGRWDAAEAALQRLVAGGINDSTDAGTLFVLAMIQWQQGEHEEARRTFDRANAIPAEKPSDPNVSKLAIEAAALLTPRETDSSEIDPDNR